MLNESFLERSCKLDLIALSMATKISLFSQLLSYLIPAWKTRRDPVQIPQQAGGITMQLYGQQALSPWAAAKHRHRPANFSALLRFPFTTESQWDFMCLAPHFPKLWEPNIQTFQ